ncbi:MAG: 23S rRNA (guanosine(2251)-2'-O)-methyltransferase RlmB [Bacteroidetes bacterium]|nr:23S rRNA (guanosine(2251)-2'-O)-methyltransferase RlmB [Bacteroidota bacterium]
MSKDNFIYGIRPVIEAIKSGKEIDKVFIQNGLRGEIYLELLDEIKLNNVPFQYVPLEKLNKLTMKNHQGVACFTSMVSYTQVENLIPIIWEQGKTPLLLILDRITDVRNFGAIARTAECAGVDAIIIPAKGGAQINSDALKTSAGALNSLPVCRSENLKHTIDFLRKSGLQIIAASEKGGDYHYKVDYTAPTAIIMGSEEDGVSPEYLRLCDNIVKIPIMGEIASLNVSVACGVIIYEALKQRLTAK